MAKRFLSIWFRHLATDWFTVLRPDLKGNPLILTVNIHGRLAVTAANIEAEQHGVYTGMAAADAKAVVPGLQEIDDIPGLAPKLLKAIGEWCIRFTPAVAIDLPDGVILDISGCPHLWGGEREYLKDIVTKLRRRGYDVRAAIADTIGTAWAIARFGKKTPLIAAGEHAAALLQLPPAALRLDPLILERLQKLGFYKIEAFAGMPRSALRRRFGQQLLQRLDQALGNEEEVIVPLQPLAPYEERLPCLEPIRTATGIEIGLQKLLDMLCARLQKEGKGIRSAILKGYRIDGIIVQAQIGTNRATHHTKHLFKLFELKLPNIEPALGIELFTLEAQKVEPITIGQEMLWTTGTCGLEDICLAELLDRIAGKVGAAAIHRYLPQEHYWPERSIKATTSLTEIPATEWRTDRPRPAHLLSRPEPIEVSVQVPDYPPMLFVHKGKLHRVKKADGPERIEREWWLETGELRDYYYVEDEEGQRYWLFRSDHYKKEENNEWFLHGIFA